MHLRWSMTKPYFMRGSFRGYANASAATIRHPAPRVNAACATDGAMDAHTSLRSLGTIRKLRQKPSQSTPWLALAPGTVPYWATTARDRDRARPRQSAGEGTMVGRKENTVTSAAATTAEIQAQMANDDYRRDLGNGLVVRWSAPEDVERVAALYAQVFRPSADAPPAWIVP